MNICTPLFLSMLLLPKVHSAQWSSTNGPRRTVAIYDLIATDSVVFASAECGVFVSAGQGNSWQPVDPIPARTSTLFQGSVYMCNDDLRRFMPQGASWQIDTLNSIPGVMSDVLAMNGSLTACSSAGFFHSPDGNGWTANNVGLPLDSAYNWWNNSWDYSTPTSELASDGDYLYIATPTGVYRAVSNDAPWEIVGTDLPSNAIDALCGDPDAVLAAIGNQLFRSTDHGSTWNVVYTINWGYHFNRIVANGSVLYACTSGAGVFYSTDDGQFWLSANSGLSSLETNDVAELNGVTYLAATDGVFTGFPDWSQADEGIICSWIRDLNAIGNTIVAVDFHDAFRRQAGGLWQQTTAGLPSGVLKDIVVVGDEFLLNRAPPDFSYPSCWNYTAPMNATPWANVSALPNFGDPYSLRSDGERIIAFEDDLLFLSEDHGASWQDISPPAGMVCNGLNDGGWYGDTIFITACGEDDVIRSMDLGVTWQMANVGLPGSEPYFFGSLPIGIFVATYQGLFRSVDGGDTWYFEGNGLPSAWSSAPSGYIQDMVAVPPYAILCTNSNVYASDGEGGYWTPISEGLPALPNIYAGALLVLGDTLLLGTNNYGVYKRALQDLELSIPRAGSEMMAKVWPNPSRDQLHVSPALTGPVVARDATGRSVVLVRETGGTFSLHGLPAGTYTLQGMDTIGRLRSARFTVLPADH